MRIEDILSQRGTIYGEYTSQAYISQRMKAFLRDTPNWHRLAPDQADALEMVVVKMARILNGDPDYADNWSDMAGYPTLVAVRLAGKDGTP